MTRVAALLRAYRDATGLTWSTIGKTCGMSSTYLHDVAQGRRRVRPARAQRYAVALGLDVEEWTVAALDDELDANGGWLPPSERGRGP